MRRTATIDTKIRGKVICKGDKVVLWYGSANRDEDVFDDPYNFDVTRNGSKHLSFGVGAHICIGSRLAEMQIRILFKELLRAYPNIRIDGPIDKLRSNFMNGVKRMRASLS